MINIQLPIYQYMYVHVHCTVYYFQYIWISQPLKRLNTVV